MEERPTPSHPPDVGGDIPAAAAHSSETLELKINGETRICSCLPRPRSPWFKEGRRWQQGSSSAGRVCPHMLERGPQVDSQRAQTEVTKRESESFCVHKIYQVVLSNQTQLVLEHFLLISILKIQIWDTGISFLFDHVVPQWPAGPLRSNHYNFDNRNLCNNRFFLNNIHKSIHQIFFIIRHFSINNRKISIKDSETQN